MQFIKRSGLPYGYQILLLTLTSILLFSVTLGHDFITTWDDDKYVVTNEIIRQLSLQNLRAAFSSFILGNYAPLHHLSYMLDYAISGVNPMVYHLHNVILHTLNGVLFYLLLSKTEGGSRTAFIAAFIFLVHPVQVETVAWVSQRKNLLCMTLFLLSFLAYVNFLKERKKSLYWLSVAFFAMALLAKSVALFLPLLLLAYDLLRSERRDRWVILDKIPYLVLGIACGIVAMISQMPEQGGGRSGYYGGSPYATLLTMIPVFCRYLYNLLWPLNLSADYLVPIKTAPDGEVVACAILLAALALPVFYGVKRNRACAFWIIAALLAILPVAQLVPIVTLMNDRYLYFPMLGIATLLAGMISFLAERGKAAKLAALLLCACLLALPWLTWQRAGVWQNGFTLWQDVLHKTPAHHIAMTSLGDTFRETGNRDEALRLYRQALELNPDYFIALNNISKLLLETDQLAEADGYLMRLIRTYPKYPKGFEMLGILREFSGDLAGAESAYSQALHLDPDLGESLISLATLQMRKGDRASAETLLGRARLLTGDSPELFYSLSCLEAQSGDIDLALDHLLKATRVMEIDSAMVSADPCFAGLREDPRFLKIMGISVEKLPVTQPQGTR